MGRVLPCTQPIHMPTITACVTLIQGILCLVEAFIITWMLHQILMYSEKVMLAVGLNNDTSIEPRFPYILPSYERWTNLPINEVHISQQNGRYIFPCQYIHVYLVCIETDCNPNFYTLCQHSSTPPATIDSLLYFLFN